MTQKFDIGLNSKISEFANNFSIQGNTENDDDIFEDFSNYTVVSNILEEEIEDLTKISTNKAKGIDGIAIIVNNKLILEESDLKIIGENEKIQIEIAFIQSTIQKSFE
ncbi:MAG: hypothetical protein U9P82_03955 [Bacteroidota bacterium]|nr:hypothetical protein [Bacteroidota bacterium]